MADAPPARVLRSGVRLESVSPGLWSDLPPPDRAASYDRMAQGYDLLVGNPVYNRIVWGSPIAAYRDAARSLLEATGDRDVLDFGCGSLVFTAATYARSVDRLILFDRSLAMLQRGQRRLPNGCFVQGDAFEPPFARYAFGGAMAWGMVHLFGSASPYLDQLRACVAPGAPVATSSIVLAGRATGDAMLRLLHRNGEAAEPEVRATVEAAFAARFDLERSHLRGNMLFLTGRARA